ncbi:hypothetical protein D1007_19322 [Hordeum vulgare]|nr:hypothetical protein D1007_19322 [Hordeum vulgare]
MVTTARMRRRWTIGYATPMGSWAHGLELDLHLSRNPISNRPYSLHAVASNLELKDARRARKRSRSPESDTNHRVALKRRMSFFDDDSEPDYNGYTALRMLFSRVARRGE